MSNSKKINMMMLLINIIKYYKKKGIMKFVYLIKHMPYIKKMIFMNL